MLDAASIIITDSQCSLYQRKAHIFSFILLCLIPTSVNTGKWIFFYDPNALLAGTQTEKRQCKTKVQV